MWQKIRRLITPELKEKVVYSFPFRLYNRWKMGKKFIRFSIEITTKCNNNCSMCTRGRLIKQGRLKITDMANETVKSILEQIKIFVNRGYQVTFAPMGMGEPLLFKNLYPLIGDLKGISPKVKVEIVTNGVLLDGKMAKKLVDLGVDEINISLNVNNSADYKRYVGGDKYQLVVDNIKNLILYRNKRAAEGTNVFIQYLEEGI